MTNKISFINLKGGVGKTTLAVNISANLAYYHKKRVLLIDLDPQTNSTVSLIPPATYYEEYKGKNRTLQELYKSKIDPEISFKFRDLVIKKAGNVRRLHLLASDLELIDVDIRISHIPNNHAIIRNAIEDYYDNYDYVIFDCPPNLGLLTQNGLFSSNYYIVPVQPDFLSTFGLDLVKGRVNWFKENIGKSASRFDLSYGGLIFSRVRHTTEHRQKILELRSRVDYQPVLTSMIFERTAISEASARSLPICLSKTGFGWKDVDLMFRKCTEEFIELFPSEEGE